MLSPRKTLKKFWGYDSFRPLQEDIIKSVLDRKDTLGLMPTGGGKSITFQVPGMIFDGLTLVITPLISLMKDQVDNLKNRNIKAIYLHSGMTRKEVSDAYDRLTNSKIKFLYISPERLKNENFRNHLRMLPVSLIVVDEAHCISQWGYDFRPSYLFISKARHLFPDAPILALTATATPKVAQDICERLEMKDYQAFRMSFARPNINYIVRRSEMKLAELIHILGRTTGTAIVYVRSRKGTKDLAAVLQAEGFSSDYYHAGLTFEQKEERQTAWKNGTLRVIVATNAFGMGIDKPDVRVVIHYDVPPSLEEYYQEAGRAGRDGFPSYAVLLVSEAEKTTLRRRVTNHFPERDFIRKVYDRIGVFSGLAIGEGHDRIKDFNLQQFCTTYNFQEQQCKAAVHLLHQAGYLEYYEDSERQAKVMIQCSREELYSLADMSRDAENLIATMLRMYPGLFSDLVTINEDTLARILNINTLRVYDALLELSRSKIIKFIPRSRSPFIYFPTAFEDADHIKIGKEIYEDRKKDLKFRVESMIVYAYSLNDCRENMMLEYFGEKRDAKCHSCDVCRSLIKKQPYETRLRNCVREILNILDSTTFSLAVEFILRNVKVEKEVFYAALRFLQTEGYITIKEGMIKKTPDE